MSPENQKTLVSLIICTYNQEQLILEALVAAIAQTYSPLEIIVSDDCSSDNTFRVIEEFAENYCGPHHLLLNRNKQNLGIARHWDSISRKAKGRLVVHAAGDDISVRTRVEELVDAWTSCDPQPYLLSSNGMVMSYDGFDLYPLIELPESNLPMIQPGPNGVDFDVFDIYVTGFALAVDKRLYEQLPPLTTWMWSEDDILRSRALLLGSIAFLPRSLVRYREGGLSKGADPNQKSYLERFSAQALGRLNYLEQLTKDFEQLHGSSLAFSSLIERKKTTAHRRIMLVNTSNCVHSFLILLKLLACRIQTEGVTHMQYINIFMVRWFPRIFFGVRRVFRTIKPN